MNRANRWRSCLPKLWTAGALTEATLSQAVALQLATATLLESGETEACFAHLCESAVGPESDLRGFHAVGEMYREVCQDRAIELVMAQGVTNRIVVSAEIVSETPQQMLPKIDRLKDHLPADFESGISISLAKTTTPKRSIKCAAKFAMQSYCWPVPAFKAAAVRFWSWNRAPGLSCVV